MDWNFPYCQMAMHSMFCTFLILLTTTHYCKITPDWMLKPVSESAASILPLVSSVAGMRNLKVLLIILFTHQIYAHKQSGSNFQCQQCCCELVLHGKQVIRSLIIVKVLIVTYLVDMFSWWISFASYILNSKLITFYSDDIRWNSLMLLFLSDIFIAVHSKSNMSIQLWMCFSFSTLIRSGGCCLSAVFPSALVKSKLVLPEKKKLLMVIILRIAAWITFLLLLCLQTRMCTCVCVCVSGCMFACLWVYCWGN